MSDAQPTYRIFDLTDSGAPILATALHDGHAMRPEVLSRIKLSEAERLREEDPFTAEFARVCESRIVGKRSRFEVDLNRPREQAIYQTPAEAWGLDLWKDELPLEVVEQSLAQYDDFYAALESLLRRLVEQHRQIVVLDIHSYNHRREGAESAFADAATHPEVNLGVGSLDREYWGALLDWFKSDLNRFDYFGRRLDVRENVKFFGGNMSKWIHRHFPNQVCSISIEFKKFFMDEWTGTPDWQQIEALTEALRSTLPGLHESRQRMADHCLSSRL